MVNNFQLRKSSKCEQFEIPVCRSSQERCFVLITTHQLQKGFSEIDIDTCTYFDSDTYTYIDTDKPYWYW